MLYQAHGLSLVRLAVVMLGDQQQERDVAESPEAIALIGEEHREVMVAPLTAAAVVAAIAVGLTAVRDARNAPSASPAPPAVSAAGTVPRYYVALNNPSGKQFLDEPLTSPADRAGLVLGDLRTGKRLAAVSPPKGQTFGGVTAAADDRTFVAATWKFPAQVGIFSSNPAAWYLLRLAAGSGTAKVTLAKLSIPAQPRGTMVSGIALSPNGRELAVMFQRGVFFTGPIGPLTLQVYSIPSGKIVHTWTESTRIPKGFGWYWGRYSNSSMTWLADGRTLAFDYGGLTGENGPPFGGAFHNVTIRTLNTTRQGHGLIADSKAVFSLENSLDKNGGYSCLTLQLTADGKTVLCGTYGGGAPASSSHAPRVIAYSVKTGQSRIVYERKGAYGAAVAEVLWASGSGTTLAGSVLTQVTEGKTAGSFQSAGTITNGTFKPLRFPLAFPPFAGEVAF